MAASDDASTSSTSSISSTASAASAAPAFVRLFNVAVPVDDDPGKDDFNVHESLLAAVKRKLRTEKIRPNTEKLKHARVVRKAFDARKRTQKRWVYVVDVPAEALPKNVKETRGQLELVSGSSGYHPNQRAQHLDASREKLPVVVVGSGPAGLFAAMQLASSGVPVVLCERGRKVEDRGKDIGRLVVRREINPESNFNFGEGGAGTWSDAKLTTRIGRNDDPVRQVLETFVKHGAPEHILYTGKPHLGTDGMVRILKSFRKSLTALGVDVRFNTRVVGFEVDRANAPGIKSSVSSLRGVLLDDGSCIKAEACVLAPGHSARELYQVLVELGAELLAKPFAVGFRLEHPQRLIDELQYGAVDADKVQRGKGTLPVADYKLTWNDQNTGRGTYSFCMCPGGSIEPTSITEDELCINGMSFSRRNSLWANSAIVCTIGEDDFAPFLDRAAHPALAGVEFQKHIERRAAEMGGGNFTCPVQTVPGFLSGTLSDASRLPSSSYRLGVKSARLDTLYPPPITSSIKDALREFGRMKGPKFVGEDALLHGAETRTSSPVVIVRDRDSLESTAIKGLYPAGEGAGYAGGIVSVRA